MSPSSKYQLFHVDDRFVVISSYQF